MFLLKGHSCRLLKHLISQKYSSSDPSARQRATLVITDRSMDMLAPFIHEFTYQAMANDLLPIEGGTKYTFVSLLRRAWLLPLTSTPGTSSNPPWEPTRTKRRRCPTQTPCGPMFATCTCGKLSTNSWQTLTNFWRRTPYSRGMLG